MDLTRMYDLPKLGYSDSKFAPIISEDLFRLHQEKHHAAYANGAYTILQKIALADKIDFNIRTARRFSEDFVAPY